MAWLSTPVTAFRVSSCYLCSLRFNDICCKYSMFLHGLFKKCLLCLYVVTWLLCGAVISLYWSCRYCERECVLNDLPGQINTKRSLRHTAVHVSLIVMCWLSTLRESRSHVTRQCSLQLALVLVSVLSCNYTSYPNSALLLSHPAVYNRRSMEVWTGGSFLCWD